MSPRAHPSRCRSCIRGKATVLPALPSCMRLDAPVPAGPLGRTRGSFAQAAARGPPSVSPAGRAGAALRNKEHPGGSALFLRRLSRPDGTRVQTVVGSSSRWCRGLPACGARPHRRVDWILLVTRVGGRRFRRTVQRTSHRYPCSEGHIAARVHAADDPAGLEMSGPTCSGPVAAWSSPDRRPRVTATGAARVTSEHLQRLVSGADFPSETELNPPTK